MAGKTYTEANKAAWVVLDKVVAANHGWLAEEKVKIRWLFVEPPRDKHNKPTGPAIALAGHPCAARIKLCSARDQLLSGADAVLEVAADTWRELPKGSRLALLDHEITHLQPALDSNGCTQRDAAGRAKLFLRPDDYLLTGFYEIGRRHGLLSLEVASLANVLDGGELGQLVFDFAKKLAGAKSKEEAA